jgi:hypothetical protein
VRTSNPSFNYLLAKVFSHVYPLKKVNTNPLREEDVSFWNWKTECLIVKAITAWIRDAVS